MARITITALSLFVTFTALAQAPAPAIVPAPDAKMALISSDLRTLSRVSTLAADLDNVRQVMLAIIDKDVETLRERRPDDTYRWASLQREEASRV
jgi:hypothetical protein